jgi:F-type H+-transporting ATPase subunit b
MTDLFSSLVPFVGRPATTVLGAPVVDVDGTIFIQGGLFLALVFLLQPLLFKPWLEVQAKRSQEIDGAIKKAGTLETQADEAREKCDAKLAAARDAAISHRSEVRVSKEADAEQLLAEARKEATAKMTAERERLEGELESARGALESKVDELATEIATKVLGRSA